MSQFRVERTEEQTQNIRQLKLVTQDLKKAYFANI